MNPSEPTAAAGPGTADSDEQGRHPDQQGSHPAAGVDVRVADTVIARIAAHYTRQVPGVAALHPGMAQSMLGLAGRLLGSRREVAETLSTAGVSVDIDGQAARIAITVILRAGYNCRDTAEAIQTHVSDHITTQTGLATIVTVTITDIEFDHNTDEHTAQPPALRDDRLSVVAVVASFLTPGVQAPVTVPVYERHTAKGVTGDEGRRSRSSRGGRSATRASAYSES